MAALLTTSEAAAYLRISRSHMEHNYRAWGIRPVRAGRLVRFSPAELDRYIANRERGR
jgi:excisionase family DNA binding protein